MKNTANLLQTILPLLASRKATVALALLALLSTLNPQLSTVLAQGTTAFTYQGKLASGTNAASGIYDLRFAICDAAIGGNTVGGPVTNSAAAVTNGYFSVSLDFGSGMFNGNARWLEIGVRTNGAGNFITLSPRQLLTPAPYSIFAANSALLSGQAPSAYAPASGSTAYVARSGDTMTGTLNLPANGLVAGGNQLTLSGGKVGMGTAAPDANLMINGSAYSGLESNFIGTHIKNTADGGDATLWLQNSAKQAYIRLKNNYDATWLKIDDGTTTKMVIGDNGSVGIGTTNPQARLDVLGNILLPNGSDIRTRTSSGTIRQLLFADSADYVELGDTASDWAGIKLFPGSGSNPAMTLQSNGNVGIGTASPALKLDVGVGTGTLDGMMVHAEDGRWTRFLPTLSAGCYNPITQDGDQGIIFAANNTVNTGTFVIAPWATTNSGIRITSTNTFIAGTVAVNVLQILGGSDVAEPFNLSTKEIPKGAVVVIDDENPGLLKMSDRSYDKRVAGIVSGANGINPGLTLRQEGVMEGGQNVALSGRVYALADASYGPIKPGDLLTTSDTAGHCRSVGDAAKAQGAIIGKAMSALKEGKGMVLVLVSLQ